MVLALVLIQPALRQALSRDSPLRKPQIVLELRQAGDPSDDRSCVSSLVCDFRHGLKISTARKTPSSRIVPRARG
jgi:hypothetical protein